MAFSARRGRLELRRAAGAPARAERVRSVDEARALLRNLRIDRATARRLVGALGYAPVRDDELEHRLAVLLWRGTYVLVRHAPAVGIPAVEEPAEPDATEGEEKEPPVGESEDSLPTAIVPREYPRLAGVITQGTWDAVGKANQDLEALLHAAPVALAVDELPPVYREVAETTLSGVKQATNDAIDALEALRHVTDPTEPQDQVPDAYRHIAEAKKGLIKDVAQAAADALDRLTFVETELATLDGGIHTDELPKAYRTIADAKVEGIRTSAAGMAERLNALLYRGESIEPEGDGAASS